MFITLNAAWGKQRIMVNTNNILSIYESTVEGREVMVVKMVGGERFDVRESFDEIKERVGELAYLESSMDSHLADASWSG